MKTLIAAPTEEIALEEWLPHPVESVFPFFADAYNLEKITPPFLRFRVLGTSTASVGEGTLIDYRLRLRGIPFRWQSRIESWEPGVRFVDRQVRGPYSLWHHTHEFGARDGGTIVRDRVLYRVPFGILGYLVAGALVARDVRDIFAFRRAKIREIFAVDPGALRPPSETAPVPPPRVSALKGIPS